jgi:outer membrane protein OmpA-like peptidoglycan-associated protein
MVRIFLASAALVGALGLAQAAVPHFQPINSPPQSPLKQSYVVFFEEGKTSLTPEARLILQSAAHQAYAMPKSKVQVSLPTGANSMAALVRNRARAVKAELVRDGVQPGSIGNADRLGDVAYSNTDPAFRKWVDRSATVEILPLADSNGQVG